MSHLSGKGEGLGSRTLLLTERDRDPVRPTGISLALAARSKGYKCILSVPAR